LRLWETAGEPVALLPIVLRIYRQSVVGITIPKVNLHERITMSQPVKVATTLERPAASPSLTSKRQLVAMTQFLFIVLLIALGVSSLAPPRALPASAPLTEFSAERAMAHLRVICQRPHPIGSAEHQAVRDYITARLTELGVAPEIQTTSVINQEWGNAFPAATVQNIVARLKGSEGNRAILLAAHYDTVPTSPGASDDGSGVATLLETLRALKQGPTLKNDVIFLFSDGEEIGMLGAKAFLDEHPWAKDIGVALNFEARGNQGPSLMFETSGHNGWLIKEFARAAPEPVANSLTQEIYKSMGLDTDLSMFKKQGIPGLNFAFIDGQTRYHVKLDNLEQVSQDSIQHDGVSALALTRHLGNLDLTANPQSDAVYFDVLGTFIVSYPSALAIPFAGIVTALLLGVIGFGLKRRVLTAKGLGWGLASSTLCVILIPLTIVAAWQVIRLAHSGYRLMPQGSTYNGSLYAASFIAIAIAIAASIYLWASKKIGVLNLAASALIWWSILMIFTAVSLPGGSYVFTWPLLFTLIGLAYLLATAGREGQALKRSVVLSLCAAPVMIIVVPLVYLLSIGLSLNMLAIVGVVVGLLMALLIPHLDVISAPNRWLLPGVSALVGLGLIIAASLTSGFSERAPKPDNIFYALNTDLGKAVWASFDQKPDAYTSQFFSSETQVGGLTDYFPIVFDRFLKVQAPALQAPAPDVAIVSDRTSDGVRTLQLRASSPRRAPIFFLYVQTDEPAQSITINNQRLTRKVGTGWVAQYYAVPAEGVDLTLQVQSPAKVQMKAMDISYGLPELPGTSIQARPNDLMPVPYFYSDVTLVTKAFTF
jgi:Peptidase family M28